MPPQFLDNPYEIEEWETDDDLELSRDEEWLTLPIPIELLPDWTPGPFIPAEEGSDEDLFSDESYDWFVDNSDEWIDHNSDDDDDDDDDDEEYNIDDEPYEESEVFDELENDIDESGGSSNASFNDLYIDERDEDDDSIIDYVTYPLPSENNTKTTTTESNSNNLSSDTETD